ncbi:sarcosine oxidase subunit gamma family protein [Amylibacter sp. IMCC11727]|uniref:sarcosine oxidase subunit gamma n=1 Tax=Amylibacter sp. IMCC11727 TaxID=3039851 RepID=UPI00244DE989|nr:sarcosine oxidase subunit gamma family protein [Amylibacter sp. IMCC11727]WGI21821.1 sarcosine oxidase subunit gamma family protein [Amylibacter sp. IMCC11727]
MVDFTLESKAVLDGFNHDWNGTRLRELTEMAAVAVSVPKDGAAALNKKLKTAYGANAPAAGESFVGKGDARVMSFAEDQFMILFNHTAHSGVPAIEKKLGDTGYYVEQTNNWVFLELSGPLARAALERLCPINTHPDKFPVDRAERTNMEHMGAVLCRTGEDTFLIMSASSTAGSFLHALETSVEYVS